MLKVIYIHDGYAIDIGVPVYRHGKVKGIGVKRSFDETTRGLSQKPHETLSYGCTDQYNTASRLRDLSTPDMERYSWSFRKPLIEFRSIQRPLAPYSFTCQISLLTYCTRKATQPMMAVLLEVVYIAT